MGSEPPFLPWTRANQIACYTIDNLPSLRLGTGNSLTADIINVTTLNATSINSYIDVSYNVRNNGAVGNGISNDTTPFVNGFKAWRASARSNLAPNSDGNKIGTLALDVPAGSYLLKLQQAMLDSNRGTRTNGLSWRGMAGGSQCQILYQPVVSGPLFSNNDEVLWLQIKDLWFNGNDAASDFLDSVSTGGAARVEVESCRINGTWQYWAHLTGNNTNSEYTFEFCEITGDWTAFIYSETSDQFLNYWFNQCTVSVFTGIFLDFVKGGHIKINECDFSGFAGLAGSTTLFNLLGSTHSEGVCTFIETGSRYEIGPNLKVMHSEWPFGQISIHGCDYTSQAFQAWATTVVTHEFIIGNNAGPTIDFLNCNFIGIHRYQTGNSSWWAKKQFSYTNCASEAFEDFFSMLQTSLDTGGGFGGLPPIMIKNCRGKQVNFILQYTAWAASTSVPALAIRSSGIWVYQTTLGGTTGTSIPFGAGFTNDGGVTDWVCLNKYQSVHYVNDCVINANKVTSVQVPKNMAYFHAVDGKWPVRVSASVPAATRIVIPPNCTLTRIVLHCPAGATSQASNGTWLVQTDEASPTVFISETTTSNMNLGFDFEWVGNFNVGTGLARAIILQCGTDVTTAPDYPAIAYLEYI